MKPFLLLTLLLLAGTALAQLWLPWWTLVPVALLLGWALGRPGSRPFLAGLLGVGLSWALPAAWLSSQGAALLAGRVATLLPLGGQPALLILLSSLLAGLLGGLAALAGTSLRRLTSSRPTPTTPLG